MEERDSGVVVGGIWQVRIARPLTFSTSVTLIVRSGFIDIVPLSQGWPPPAGKNTESSKQIMALPLEGGGGGGGGFLLLRLGLWLFEVCVGNYWGAGRCEERVLLAGKAATWR